MAPGSRKNKRDGFDAYSTIRKPVPPPERIERDRRRELQREESQEEIDEALGGGPGDSPDEDL